MIQLIIRLILAYYYSAFYKQRRQGIEHDLVTVVVPVYNEDPRLFVRCLKSIFDQSHTKLEVIVVDDGSTAPIETDIPPSLREKIKLIRLPRNCGKMRAQAEGIYAADERSAFILTVDSDTIISEITVDELLSQFDDKTGAVCGEVKIISPRGINKIIQYLYWNAFHIWRAGSSFTGQVMVCSGAISMYRKAPLINGILEEYLNRNVEVGNDRFITYLFLKHGWDTRYAEDATAVTDAPRGWKFIVQQVRWNRSFWRGLAYSWPIYGFRRWYFTLDMLLKAISRIVTMTVFIWSILLVAAQDWSTLAVIFLVALAYGLIHSVAGMVITRDIRFAAFALWGPASILVIAPVNIYSVLTALRDKWGTR